MLIMSDIVAHLPVTSCYQEKESKMADDKTLLLTTEAQLEKADAEMAVQNWEATNKLLKQALDKLGNRYICAGHNVIDESGMKLIAADIQEKEGKLDNAAHVRRRILIIRLEKLRIKINQ